MNIETHTPYDYKKAQKEATAWFNDYYNFSIFENNSTLSSLKVRALFQKDAT